MSRLLNLPTFVSVAATVCGTPLAVGNDTVEPNPAHEILQRLAAGEKAAMQPRVLNIDDGLYHIAATAIDRTNCVAFVLRRVRAADNNGNLIFSDEAPRHHTVCVPAPR